MVYSRKQKLRPELAKLPNEEIRDRRLAGEVCALSQLSGLLLTVKVSNNTCRRLWSYWKHAVPEMQT